MAFEYRERAAQLGCDDGDWRQDRLCAARSCTPGASGRPTGSTASKGLTGSCIVKGWSWPAARSSAAPDCGLDALEQALRVRQPERDDALLHHSERGSQHVSIRYSERRAQTSNGRYKAGRIRRRAARKTREAVELTALERAPSFNDTGCRSPSAISPPGEAEANYRRLLANQVGAMVRLKFNRLDESRCDSKMVCLSTFQWIFLVKVRRCINSNQSRFR